MMKNSSKTMKKTINLRKTLKITNHLKVIENHFNTIISSPNASQLFQSHSTVSEKLICKINLNKIDNILLQQIKQQKNMLKSDNIHKSLLSDKLLKELEKQIQLLNKLKIENNIFKKMYFFKCCCAKKNCKKSKSNKKIKKKRSKKNMKIKRATQLQLFDNDENREEISRYIPEFDKISILNEKLMAADQKTSNLEIVSPSCSVNQIRATKSESLFSYSSTNNKYSKNKDLARLPQSEPKCETNCNILMRKNKNDNKINEVTENNSLDPKLNLSQKITQENVMKEKTFKINDLDTKLDELVSLFPKKKCNLNTIQENVKEVKTNEDDFQKNIMNNKTATNTKTLIPTQDNVIVKDVRNNTIESLIPIDKIIAEANKNIKDKKDVWFERKLNKCRKSKVNEKFFEVDYTNKEKKIVTSTQELIDERELHLVFNKNQEAAAADVCFKDVNVKPIKRKTNMEKKKKVRDVNKWIKLDVTLNPVKEKSKNESDSPKKETQVAKKKEHEFLKPMTPDEKMIKKKRKSNNSLMNNTGVGLSDISHNLLENQKMLEIRKRIELWQEFGSPWVNDAISMSEFEDVEADDMKNQMNQGTQTFWESPNFSPIPKM